MAHWLAIVAFAAAAAAQARPATLRVMGFAGSANLPIFIAQEKGLFAARGLKVNLAPAPNSTTQIAVLRNGQIDIALTAMDNIVPYPDELFAFLGMNDGGRISLVAVPGIKRVGELRDRALAVDAIASGYAFVLMEILARSGLAPGDYRLVSVGGSRERRLGVDAHNAERSYAELFAQGSLARKAALDVDGIRAVLALRRRFAPSPPPSSDPARYYDLSYYEKALTR